MRTLLSFILFCTINIQLTSQILTTEELETKWNNHFQLAQQQLQEQQLQQAEQHLIICKQLLYDNDASQSIYFFQTLSLLAGTHFLLNESSNVESTINDYTFPRNSII